MKNIKNIAHSKQIMHFHNNTQKTINFGMRLAAFITLSLITGRAFEIYVIEPKKNKRFEERFAKLAKSPNIKKEN